MVYKSTLNKRDGELQVYLFDHALLFAKQVKTKQHEQYKVYRRVSFHTLSMFLVFPLIISSQYLWNFSSYPLPTMLPSTPPLAKIIETSKP
jgi:hypothetical protein